MEFHSLELTVFWARVIGLFMVIFTASALVRRHRFAQLEKNLYENPGAVAVSALLFVLIGLLVVVSHNVWEWSWRVIITLGGWIFLTRGTLRLFMPEIDTRIAFDIDTNGRNRWLVTVTLVSFLLFNLWILYMAFTV